MNNRFTRRAHSSGLHWPGWLASVILLAPLVSSCALGPDFEEPEAPVAQEWVEVDDAEITNRPADYPEWWTVFNDPVLNELIEMARSQNLTLRSAGLRVLQAHAQLGIATGSRYPQVQQVTGSANRVELSDNATDNFDLLENSFALYNLDFNLSWEIDFWGRFRRLIESTEAQLQANNLAPELLARAETAEKNADIAIKKANAAEEAMKLAKEDAIKDRAALQAEHNAAVSALEMRLRTSEESVSESSLRPVEVHLQIGDQLHAAQMEDAVTQAETAAILLALPRSGQESTDYRPLSRRWARWEGKAFSRGRWLHERTQRRWSTETRDMVCVDCCRQ